MTLTHQILLGTGRGTSVAVEGEQAGSPSAVLRSTHLPLHHPLDGPPPPVGEE
jgi:hypothetical protein